MVRSECRSKLERKVAQQFDTLLGDAVVILKTNAST
jgi:hypothetical protein